MHKESLKILQLNASSQRSGSVSRQLSGELIAALEDRHAQVAVTSRDLADGTPLIDEAWIAANFTADEERTPSQKAVLALSDELVSELQEADEIVIGVPIYNFSIPAALKAWIDLVARARLTFRYTENGPVGLLTGKKAWLVVASGGVPVGSKFDFATPYLRHALSFIGIEDVVIIAADRINTDKADAIDRARAGIAAAVHLPGRAA